MQISFTRRFLLGTLVAAGLASGVARPASAEQSATAFVHSLGDRLVTIVNSDLSGPQKKEKVLPILQSDVDVDAIGRFCLGRYWRTATPEQQTEYLNLFRQIMLNKIIDNLGDYRGVSFTMGGTVPKGEDQSVNTVLHRPHQADANLEWVVSNSSGSPKIIDLLIEAASLRLTQRQDYASFIQQHGGQVSAILNALKIQVERHKAPKAD
ncbi:toluene tolerance family protein [Acetobacter aceti NRIC 0242]|uniref:Toluene transporter n=2 Tax=Acetobacter aceti TaxID=435 RepID=A0A6S6PCN5_ACEAC|nr:ABC transporter substrate-binding protein [Acetobacter aceti]GBO81523.1 toluene tolerance family protein [Acetobacter aceti NRIC 0242]TCS31035.1 phospholipid transport system substrate-binding protein [Acetobacter aceti NBRC 14818]BCI65418.1 hypothetical protein AAJCM20276_00420 [Acetobacter aceti]BCK76597.1 hypothetical protein EMQ_2203 [Acetobacter aceti NBRC 14818]GAN58568.1 ABC transporter toluene transporter auxiliary component [Acetobacter aceti NBRC 14818]